MRQALAVKYRPKTFNDVTEQKSTKIILQQQLETEEFQHSYLFVGSAGTGKTTCARIFANEINQEQGSPIELDAASNSGVDDVRDIIQQSKLAPIDGSRYKVFIIDECHSLSNTAWQAFLKLIEEPPARSIFVFCTTDPQKIPKTILSRVQRYDFKRISQTGIVERLRYILRQEEESYDYLKYDTDALDYIAKLAEGGMRTAISYMDKCLAYSSDLTVENVVNALGVADYSVMITLTDSILSNNAEKTISTVETIHADGIDLKQFIKQYLNFILDVKKWFILNDFEYLNIPQTQEVKTFLESFGNSDYYEDRVTRLLDTIVMLNAEIKYDSSPKYLIEAVLIKECD